MEKEIKEIEERHQRPLTEEEKDVLHGWLRDIEVKNSSPIGRLMTLHDWEQNLKRVKKEFKKANR